jgi:hypothetical protein
MNRANQNTNIMELPEGHVLWQALQCCQHVGEDAPHRGVRHTCAALEVAFLSGHKAAALQGVSCSRLCKKEERENVSV